MHPARTFQNAAPLPPDEAYRIADLISYGVLDTPADTRFDRLTAFARQQFQMPIALISLVDSDRQWFKSRDGLDDTETPRDVAFCAHAILGREPFIVDDALEHPMFRDNALVTGAPFIRFYAGVPLISKAGHALGTFCIVDRKPREFSESDLASLKMLAGIAGDMLELHRSEQILAASVARQQAANRAKTTFLQSMSHEFRTPLNAIIGFSQILRMPTGNDLSADQCSHVDCIEAAGKTLLDLTKGMLTLAQIDDDSVRRGMLLQSSQDIVDDLYCQYRCAAEGRGIELQIDDSADFAFLAHEESIRTALGNLVDNAIKFTPASGRVTIGSDNRDGMVRLYVSDTGFGIPESRQPEVFQSFNRLGREGSDITGVGLGLAIARRLTQAMDGHIGFSSTEGQGSTFWIGFRPSLS